MSGSAKLFRRSEPSAARRVYGYLLLGAVLALVYGSLVPFQFVALEREAWRQRFENMLFVDWSFSRGRVDWILNSLAGVVLGFAGTAFIRLPNDALVANEQIKEVRQQNPAVHAVWSLIKVLALVLFLSTLVEFSQVWIVDRVPSLRDIAAQFCGAFLGALLWFAVGERVTDWLFSFVSPTTGSAAKIQQLLLLYTLGLMLYSALPLDIVTSVGELAAKFDKGSIELLPFSYEYPGIFQAMLAYLMQVTVFVPVGLWSVGVARRQRVLRHEVSSGLWVGLLVVLVIEGGQIFLNSRYASVTDVMLGVVGVILGGLAPQFFNLPGYPQSSMDTSSTHRAGFSLLAVMIYLAMMLAHFWAPFEFSTDRQVIKQRLVAFGTVPFSRMQAGSPLPVAFSIFGKFAWFCGFGIAISLLLTRRAVTERVKLGLGVVVVANLALIVEMGQVLQPQRFAATGDVVICTIAGLVGLSLAVKVFGDE